MTELVEFLARHGSALVFWFVLAEQLGLPIPAIPILLCAGALAGLGRISIPATLAAAVSASLISDAVWYAFGRRKGHSVLGLLCRISLEPDSCAGSTKRLFARLGVWAVVIAKFIPGLSTVAPPMAGVTRMSLGRFLWADGAGALVWSGTYLVIGAIFRHQLESAAEWAMTMGGRVAVALVLGLAGYIGFKYWQRRRFIRSLRVARVQPREVYDLMLRGAPITIIDLRQNLDVLRDQVRLPGALWIDRDLLEQNSEAIPRDRDVILYCT